MSEYPEVGTLLKQAEAHLIAGELDAAHAIYRRILDFDPAHSEATLRLIAIVRGTGRRDDILPLIESAARSDPANPDWLVGRGLALSELGRHDEALACYDRAIALREEFADAWFAKAQLLLTLGRYKEGWELFEWRFYFSGWPQEVRTFRQPLWSGGGFHGQMLLVFAEHGLADTIQFYRFVHLARSFGGVILEVPPSLVRLFASQSQAPLVIPSGQPLPRFELQCPLMTLPMLLGTELHSVPGAAYLEADRALAAEWAKLLPPRDHRLRIGISWAGNQSEMSMTNRSMPLAVMLEMLEPFGGDAVIVSLQKEVPESDQATLLAAGHVINLGTSQVDFADAAAVISELDLVISVDTAIAHLAGAMGHPVWILLPNVSEWCWLLHREDSPWYPTARLFRQFAPDDWYSVMPAVRDALRLLRSSG